VTDDPRRERLGYGKAHGLHPMEYVFRDLTDRIFTTLQRMANAVVGFPHS
jgi:hypothetical protein